MSSGWGVSPSPGGVLHLRKRDYARCHPSCRAGSVYLRANLYTQPGQWSVRSDQPSALGFSKNMPPKNRKAVTLLSFGVAANLLKAKPVLKLPQ